MKRLENNVAWVDRFDGHPGRLAAVTVYPYRNRVSLNPAYGCTLGCAYCICSADPGFMGPKRVQLAGVDETIAALESVNGRIDGYFLHIFDHSDPFLPANRETTLKLMQRLAEKIYRQPVVISSKVAPPLALLREISQLPLKTTVFSSLADVNGNVERAPVGDRIKLVRDAHRADLHTVLLLRPVHRAWTLPEQLSPVLRKMNGHIDGVVMSGLRNPQQVKTALANRKIQIPDSTESDFLPIQNPELESQLSAVIAKAVPGVPIFQKRTCAVNRKFNLPCFPPSSDEYRWPDDKRNSAGTGGCVLRRDYNGYCQMVPETSREGKLFSPAQRIALESLSLLFDAEPKIDWCVVGGAAQVIHRMKPTCRDIDVEVSPDSFSEAVRRLSDIDREIKLRACRGPCFYISDVGRDEGVSMNIVSRSRRIALIRIAGVQIDLAANNEIRMNKRFPVGAFKIPFELDKAA